MSHGYLLIDPGIGTAPKPGAGPSSGQVPQVIHLEFPELSSALSEVRRTLRPAGRFLLAFHAGSETRHLSDWYGHAVDVDFHFLDPMTVADALQGQGFVVEAELKRRNYPTEAESLRTYLLARKT